MTTYKDAGVDVAEGDKASKAAYARAAETFKHRKGMTGAPLLEHDGFAGLLDMGDYFLAQTSDGTGTKMAVALALGKYDTIGRDLLAMVADDAICIGAEVISVTNTLDVAKVDATMVDQLLKGLAEACSEQKIVIPAGEIAEVPGAVNEPVWNATALGIVAKNRVLQPQSVKPGDVIIALREYGARSNGFSLIRKILDKHHGKHWVHEKRGKMTWGELVLTPSVIYHDAVLSLLGRYGQKRTVPVKAVAHITGGGIPSKFRRVLNKCGCGAELNDLWEPTEWLQEIITMGSVATEEAYKTWNMGNGMLVVVEEKDCDRAIAVLEKSGMEAKKAGTITKKRDIALKAFDGSMISFQ